MIQSLNLEIIDICNLQCRMCDIWKNKIAHMLSAEDIQSIFSSQYIDKSVDVCLTGGEPFLHPRIEELFFQIYLLGFSVQTISTNGTMYDKLRKLIIFCIQKNYPLPNIHISIDGDEKAHDEQRGVKGSFKKSIETIIQLKKAFKEVRIKIKYTISKNNGGSILYAYTLSKKLGVDIAYKLVENDSHYTNRLENPELLTQTEKSKIFDNLFLLYKGKSNAYIDGLLYYIQNNALGFRCTTPEDNIFVMANGLIYPCTKYPSIGNIKLLPIDNILFNEKHKDIIQTVQKTKCSQCYSLHGSYKSIL